MQQLSATDLAEMAGANIGEAMVQGIFDAHDQAAALQAVIAGLTDAFNIYDEVTAAVAGGLAAAIVNVLERGRDATRV